MPDNDNSLLGANFIAEVEDEQAMELNLEDHQISNLAAHIRSKFQNSKDSRQLTEDVWLRAYRNYRGVYGKNVRFTDHEKSRVFVKITKTKVLAAYGMLADVAFGTNEIPIGVKETDVPEGVAERAHLNTGAPTIEDPAQSEQTPTSVDNPFDPGFSGDGKTLAPGATFRSPTRFLKDLTEKFTSPQGPVLTEGEAPDPRIPEISPAKESARRMQKLMHDQIEESNGSTELRHTLFECSLLGTGVVKGPYNFNKILHEWKEGPTLDEEGNETEGFSRKYTPINVRVPRMEFVSCWDIYNDPNAVGMDDSEYIIQRRRMNRSELRGLTNMPFFNEEAIRKCLADGPNYNAEDYETQIRMDDTSITGSLYHDRFEVLEYWGIVDAEMAREMGVVLSDSVDDLDEVQVNVWLCGDEVLRAVVNPFTPHRLPYHTVPYEVNPYSFWGVGVAENMEDSQGIMNGHARMAIDNLALSGSVVFDIDETALVPGQSMKIYPGKVFRRQAGSPGQAVFAVKFPNTSQENLAMFDKFRQLADESTGIPSFSHGQTGVQSMTRTASGMSMLMGAASLNIKTVVKNLDDFLFKPLGDAYFQWNQQFFEGKLGIHGDLEVKAMGTSSLMQKEVRSQRLTTFLQLTANPAIAPFVKMDKVIEELAVSMDLDPQEILNSPTEAAIAAAIIGAQNGQGAGGQAETSGQQPGSVGGPEQLPNGPEGLGGQSVDGGSIAPGNVQAPGSDQFSGPPS